MAKKNKKLYSSVDTARKSAASLCLLWSCMWLNPCPPAPHTHRAWQKGCNWFILWPLKEWQLTVRHCQFLRGSGTRTQHARKWQISLLARQNSFGSFSPREEISNALPCSKLGHSSNCTAATRAHVQLASFWWLQLHKSDFYITWKKLISIINNTFSWWLTGMSS